MTVKAISLDELTKGSKTLDYFPDYTVRPNLITKLKIFALPATFLYNAETDQIEPLMQGLATTAEINQRVKSWIYFENNISSTATIATIWTTIRHILFSSK